MRQEVLLALLAKEPSHGSRAAARLNVALGSLGDDMNDGQIYVTLGRLDKAGLVRVELAAGPDGAARSQVVLAHPGGTDPGRGVAE